MALGERKLELDDLAVDAEPPVCVASSASAGSTRRSSMSSRLGTARAPGPGGHDRGAAREEARRLPPHSPRRRCSTLPTSSRCSGPICETTAMSGRAIAQSAATWPSPRIPISVTRISVSGSSRQTVSGRPISLLRLFSGDRGSPRAERRARPGCPSSRSSRQSPRSRPHARRSSSARGRRARQAPPPGRRARALPLRALRLVDVIDAGVERDEELPRSDLSRVGLDAVMACRR